jgi:O-antigen/teichoic acid export membrane protein
MSLSGKFFIIQIAATVIFTTNNFLISHYYGNEDVTKFNIVQRYFNIVVILQSMILVPFWAIFTEDFAKGNTRHLEDNMKKLMNTTTALGAACIVMALISPYVYAIWIGDLVKIPTTLTIMMCFYSLLMLYTSVYSTFINGTGRIKLQMLTSLLTSTLHIPFTILLIKYFHIGMPGLIITSSFWLAATFPLKFVQYKRLVLSRKKELPDRERSIWTK